MSLVAFLPVLHIVTRVAATGPPPSPESAERVAACREALERVNPLIAGRSRWIEDSAAALSLPGGRTPKGNDALALSAGAMRPPSTDLRAPVSSRRARHPGRDFEKVAGGGE